MLCAPPPTEESARESEREMLRSLGKKAMRVGRATVFLVGLSVILAMVFGVASTALAGNGVGAVFNLGQKNTVNRLSQLVGPTAGPMFRVDNDGTGTALDLKVGSPTANPATKATPPMTVDSQGRVTNLNADLLDGQDSTAFSLAGHEHDAAYVNEADHTTAAHDALNIDADTVDGIDSTGFLSANAEARGDLTGRYPDPTIANGAVTGGLGGKIADNTLDQNDIAESAVRGGFLGEIVNGTVNADDIAQNGVSGGPGGDLTDNSVDQNDIAENAARGGLTGEIANNTVNTDDIAPNGVNTDEIVDNAVRGGLTGELANESVDRNDIAQDGVGASEISGGSVSADEMDRLPVVKAKSAGTITVNNNTNTPFPLGDELIDQVGGGQTSHTEMHSTTINNHQLVAPRTGIYEVQADIFWARSTTGAGERRVIVRKNNDCGSVGGFDALGVQAASPGVDVVSHVSTLFQMNAGETVMFCGFQNSGENLDVPLVHASMHFVSR